MASRPEFKLDKGDENGFLVFYRGLVNKDKKESEEGSDSKVIRIFERGDDYSAHYKDAIYIAENVYRTISVVKYLGNSSFEEFDKGLPSVSMSATVFQNFLKDALFNQGLKIEIYAAAAGSSNRWSVVKQASPGNLLEVEELLGNQIDQKPIVIALKVQAKKIDTIGGTIGGGGNGAANGGSAPTAGSSGGSATGRAVGICFIDCTAREIGVFEFFDNDLYSNLESVLIQLGVKECVLPAFNSTPSAGSSLSPEALDLTKVTELLDRCDIAITPRKSSDFNTRDIEQDLGKLLSQTSIPISALPALNSACAMSATAALIKYLELMSQPEMFGHFSIVQHDLSQYMRLDASAIKALNLMPGPRDGTTSSSGTGPNASKSMSLFGLLNRCKTAAGTRLLGQWLKQPLMDIEEIQSRHTLVEAFVNDTVLRQTLQSECLNAIPDISRLVRKLQRNAASLEDVVRIYQMVIRLPNLITALDEYEELEGSDLKAKAIITELYTSRIKSCYQNLEKLQELVETTVDLEALDNHEFIIKPDFDDRLKEIRDRLAELREQIDDEHIRASDDLNVDREKKLKLENHHVFGWCFRLTRTDASCLRSHSGYIELSTQKAGVYFTSRSLKSLSQEFNDLSNEYNKTQSGLVREVVGIVATYSPVLEALSLVLAHLDVIVSFAQAAVFAPIPYVRPKMHPRGSGRTILKEARHPCLEAQDDMRFIPNDVTLVRDESEFLIITGPNMGGKSTYIRQIGVIALMAQVGSFVPCAEGGAELTVFDSILARVGAGDSQLKGVSTFMAEMLETATILKSATRDSLIVIDELGRGTSTYDGFGLAWAISEHIVREIGCFGMFATHFQELTGLANMYPKSVCNLHVVAHVREVETRLAMETSHSAAPGTTQGQDSDVFSSPSITLLYKVEPGVSDQSFGIHVAEVVKFPPKVIRMAKRKALELEDFEREDDGTEEGAKMTKQIKAKFSNQEIHDGSELLRGVLKEWAKAVGPLEESSGDNLTSKEILAKLNEVLNKNDFKGKMDTNPYVNSLMAQL
ncbi:uncharacterized protein SAPINGB_P000276 [Magnusiomyces paraingens]|uniref:DNA mismatch repair proteins mutS family domain-containing protein n=1 Tax=Magnusiomyces paraingens TaxID=2606893 RepID=A0A5E8AZ51_9ASCO|nr:uncharacterized protein SAPINGB_P000276 [Saprochaete ingens]VVT44048.1 unnamed protein product [Saprochaete ingens]